MGLALPNGVMISFQATYVCSTESPAYQEREVSDPIRKASLRSGGPLPKVAKRTEERPHVNSWI
jgi:hypothetical protein